MLGELGYTGTVKLTVKGKAGVKSAGTLTP